MLMDYYCQGAQFHAHGLETQLLSIFPNFTFSQSNPLCRLCKIILKFIRKGERLRIVT